MTDIVERITEYLAVGGLFNPELMPDAKVRDMAIECRNTIESLRSRLAEAERDTDQLLKERDYAEEMADKLADALATMLCVDIGEHSSGNCPWTEALEAFEERATDSATHRESARADSRNYGGGVK